MPDDLSNGLNKEDELKKPDERNDLIEQSEKSPLEEEMAKIPDEKPQDTLPPQTSAPAETPPLNQADKEVPLGDGPVPAETPVTPTQEASPSATDSLGASPVEPKIEDKADTPFKNEEPKPTEVTAGATENASGEPVPSNEQAQAPFKAPEQQMQAKPQEPLQPVTEPETSQSPDTDEFLKSILEERPKDAPVPTVPPAGEEQSVAQDAPSDGYSQQPTDFSSAKTEEPTTPPENDLAQGQMNEEEQPQPISTGPVQAPESNSMDAIRGSSPYEMAEPQNPSDENLGAIPPEEAPKPSGSPTRLIALIVVAVILVVGGYFAYTLLFSSSNTTPTGKTEVSATITSTNVSSSADQTRKADLVKIQQALLNYFAGTGKYPVSASLLYLNSAGNVVEKALVPAYINVLPADPATPTKNYAYKSDGKTFSLTAVLDNTSDPEAIEENGLMLYEVTATTKAKSPTTSATATTFVSKTATSTSDGGL